MLDRLRRLGPAAAALLAAFALTACQTGDGSKPVAGISSSGSKSIAFESIDGPPQPVFDKLVASLTTEANAQQVQVVSRESDAGYRVRGYLAASIEGGKGSVDWAWEVFDKDRERVMRVAGVEQVGKGRDVWGGLDDAMVSRIASQSLTEITTRLAAASSAPRARPAKVAPTETLEAPAVRTDDGPPVASADEPADQPSDIPADAVVPSSALTFASHP